MLRFLSSLFAPSPQAPGGPDQALIDKAIERVVDGTDGRLRLLSKYRDRLRDPVTRAVEHVIGLVDDFPVPAEISRSAYSADPRLRAFFASIDHLREVMGESQTIRSYLKQVVAPPPSELFGLLGMEWEERRVFGMELEGETIRRDVQQVTVNFFHHRYICPTGTEADTRWELKKRAFDFLIETALERIATAKSRRADLERQRLLLGRKLDAMKAGNWGLESMLTETEHERPDLTGLEAQIDSVEEELRQVGADASTLAQSIEYIADTLGRPADWLAARELCMRLDSRGIKVAENASAASTQLELTELFSCNGQKRIVLLARFPRGELPERPDFFAQAQRFLV